MFHESILKDGVTEYLEAQGRIGPSQHGFVKGRSCLTNLLEFFEEITGKVDKGEAVDVVYLDFQKAFDKVPHKRLINKMRGHGITGRITEWVEHWLVDRKQRVEIKGSRSGWLPVTSGVPQGSVLGPLLFTLYINDLDDGINGFVAKFADDTKTGGGVGSIEEIGRLQRDLDSLGEWARKWQMRFNVGKCAVVHFRSRNKRADYYLGGEKIQSTGVQRDLGVLVQNTLKVNHQVGSVVKKVNAMLAVISKGIVYKSKEVLMRLYGALVRPHLEYCAQFWAPHLRKAVLTLERVQRRFTRMIPGMKGLTYEERFLALGLYSLEYRRMRGDLIATFKILIGKDRVNVARLFPLVGESRTRGHNLRIRRYSFKTEMRKNFFSQRVVNLWNSLPRTAVEAGSVGVFKEEIDRYLNSQDIKGYGDKASNWD
ncbi:RNA-directed DNA polymerase from mobile element jockey isoform X1 [Pristis pectinata]|uniref:RNA-directed DNA polymerase from mobile element jockey isoform X1 n=1 Tax=Pristis pectinata TaxID=685728 RepID=UPI00223E7D21|nr:RNA-directed DNA polymerase from mobile element jockey isoform X1 [Pristis pectinata]XP_051876030.1 RNA-directed DNA polymerase from mobile element jockey isoform X1 [Pristis pectinata]XP_051876031.1 RNA-directed DNA polymerase from mobile element jockey isoform X1 [Pristis pectinata]XP_051876032.1 RNA-directed DNA polymerase from mobile element jockey isoform X1 [Pristis pectinata]XP_051876033.1 RNA-directed DNA polymerase from mobile element jockey isoform X1 [Pristis pectinata]